MVSGHLDLGTLILALLDTLVHSWALLITLDYSWPLQGSLQRNEHSWLLDSLGSGTLKHSGASHIRSVYHFLIRNSMQCPTGPASLRSGRAFRDIYDISIIWILFTHMLRVVQRSTYFSYIHHVKAFGCFDSTLSYLGPRLLKLKLCFQISQSFRCSISCWWRGRMLWIWHWLPRNHRLDRRPNLQGRFGFGLLEEMLEKPKMRRFQLGHGRFHI